MDKQQSIPAIIRLEVHQQEISLTEIIKNLAKPLLAEIPTKSPRQTAYSVRPFKNDFRDAVISGLTLVAPESAVELANVKLVLKAYYDQQLQQRAERARHATGDALRKSEAVQAVMQMRADALSNGIVDMRQYAKMTIEARIRKILDDDIAAGHLEVVHINGNAVVGLDSLVEWATYRKIVIAQDGLPGCEPLVQAAYHRMHLRWTNKLIDPENCAAESLAAPTPMIPAAAQSTSWRNSVQNIPGELPKIAIRKLAVEAAWQIECEEKRRATAKEVMVRLQMWADSGNEPDVLRASDIENRAVIWLTSRCAEKAYSLDACEKTLWAWNSTRD